MPYFESNKGGVGFPDFTNVLTSLTTQNAQYTATQDCWVQGIIRGDTSAAALVYVDGFQVGGCFAENTASLSAIFFPVKAGSVISTRAQYGSYDLRVYGCA